MLLLQKTTAGKQTWAPKLGGKEIRVLEAIIQKNQKSLHFPRVHQQQRDSKMSEHNFSHKPKS